MKKILIIFGICLCFSGCTTSQLVAEYTSPETVSFEANKVLVIGMTADSEIRRIFEKKVSDALEKRGVVSVKSIDFFETSFTQENKSIAQLNEIETSLTAAGFDAILFAKVTGRESKVTLVQAYRNTDAYFQNFTDYYFGNQEVYQKEESTSSRESSSYTVYTTETSLYCICPDKERELLWRGEIDIISGAQTDKNIHDYIKVLLSALEKNRLLIQ